MSSLQSFNFGSKFQKSNLEKPTLEIQKQERFLEKKKWLENKSFQRDRFYWRNENFLR